MYMLYTLYYFIGIKQNAVYEECINYSFDLGNILSFYNLIILKIL